MIISHSLKYVFVQIPHTASSALEAELCEHYEGQRVLHKHSTIFEFDSLATEEQKQYTVFATVRNPLDVAYTRFCRLRAMDRLPFDGTKGQGAKGRSWKRKQTRWNAIHEENLEYEAYFRRFLRTPFNSMAAALDSGRMTLMRYENLQQDFESVMRGLGVQDVKTIRNRNVTASKDADIHEVYAPLQDRVRAIMGPAMNHLGYPGLDGESPLKVPPLCGLIHRMENATRLRGYRMLATRRASEGASLEAEKQAHDYGADSVQSADL